VGQFFLDTSCLVKRYVHEVVIDRAMILAETHALRGYDAIHPAAALEVAAALRTHGLPPLVLVSADQEQLDAATAEGLATLNPAP
jgi:predicted nucleic acid-binding protein